MYMHACSVLYNELNSDGNIVNTIQYTLFSCLVIFSIPSVVLSAFLKCALCLFKPCLSNCRSWVYFSPFVAVGRRGSRISPARGLASGLEGEEDVVGRRTDDDSTLELVVGPCVDAAILYCRCLHGNGTAVSISITSCMEQSVFC